MSDSMKAMVFTRYGPPEVLQWQEVEKPTAADDEVVIAVRATTVAFADVHLRAGTPLIARQMAGGLLKPKTTILGGDVAGEIESIGNNVQGFREGDAVYGLMPPGRNGAHAEYVSVPADRVMAKPASLSYEEAAAVPSASMVALYFLREGNIQSGQSVLINGASGSLGTWAVQIAKSFGAEVTGVCSTRNLGLVQSLGADAVVDYTQEDFAKSGKSYDLIFDAAGKRSFGECRSSMNREGIYVSTAVNLGTLLGILRSSVGSKKAKAVIAKTSPEDLRFVTDLIEDGKARPVIDRSYPLAEIAEAHRYVEKGHARGRVVITV